MAFRPYWNEAAGQVGVLTSYYVTMAPFGALLPPYKEKSMSVGGKVIKNAAFLYLRMLLVTVASLYTVRVVLSSLGVEGYGIYTIAAGVAALFAFMNGALSRAAQRFFGVDLGLGAGRGLGATLGAVLVIHGVFALLLVAVGLAAGGALIHHWLDLPIEREAAARAVFNFSLFTVAAGILQTAFSALVIAHERMWFFSLVSILDCGIKLLIAYLISICAGDRVVLYAGLLTLASFVSLSLFVAFCMKVFPAARPTLDSNRDRYKELLSFLGWNLVGNAAAAGNTQGTNILLNLFFGVATNAAYGVMIQVQNSMMSFMTSFQNALSPQIYRSYAARNVHLFDTLVIIGSKYSFVVMAAVTLPIYHGCDYVLSVWLGNVPAGAVTFVRGILVLGVMESLSQPLMMAVQATGRIRAYQLVIGGFILTTVLWTYLAFDAGADSAVFIPIMLGVSLIALCLRLAFLRVLINLRIVFYVKSVISRLACLTLIGWLSMAMAEAIVGQVTDLQTFVISTALILSVFSLGIVVCVLSKEEWSFLAAAFRSRMRRHR